MGPIRRVPEGNPQGEPLVYETFAHTADVGLRIRAPDLPALLAEAGQALFSVIVSNFEDVQPRVRKELRIGEVDSSQPDFLLVDWLNELLFAFESDHLLFCRFHVAVDAGGLQAVAEGEAIDESRHRLAHEVKAITYHGLKVEPAEGGLLAEVIVDL